MNTAPTYTLWHTGEFGHGERSFVDYDTEMAESCMNPDDFLRLQSLVAGEKFVDSEGDTWERIA